MKPLYSQQEFENAKSYKKLPLKCYSCDNIFELEKKFIVQKIKTKNNPCCFCSNKCRAKENFKQKEVSCKYCGIYFYKHLSQINKSPNHFCSKSCSGTYNQSIKTHGTRRSKLEVWLEEQFAILYPSLPIDFNKKDAINSELDIYIPSLKLAFELNGIFHYEPIYGQEKLDKIQNNDHRKFQACAEKEISLCIIDTSSFKNFKPNKAEKYLNIIISIIKEHI